MYLAIFIIIISILLFAVLMCLDKWYGDKTLLLYKVLLGISIYPFVLILIYSIATTRNGFTLFQFGTVYGFEAIITCFLFYAGLLGPVSLSAIVTMIISIIKIIKLKIKHKKENLKEKTAE